MKGNGKEVNKSHGGGEDPWCYSVKLGIYFFSLLITLVAGPNYPYSPPLVRFGPSMDDKD